MVITRQSKNNQNKIASFTDLHSSADRVCTMDTNMAANEAGGSANEAGVSTNERNDNAVLNALKDMENRFDSRFKSLENRIQSLEETITITVKKIVAKEVQDIKINFQTEIQDVRTRVATLEQSSEKDKCECGIVLFNVNEETGENTTEKVKSIIQVGLGLNDIDIVKAERKESRKQDAPGVIIASLGSTEQRSKVLKTKKKLKDSSQDDMKDVYIAPDKPWNERKQEQNLRTIINTLGNDSLEFRGGRVFKKRDQGQGSLSSERGHSRGQGRGHRGHRGQANRGGPARNNGRRD